MFFFEKLYGFSRLVSLVTLLLLSVCETVNASVTVWLGPEVAKPLTNIVEVGSTPFRLCFVNGECQYYGTYNAYYGSTGFNDTYISPFYGSQKSPLDVEASLVPNLPSDFDWGHFNVPQFLPYDLGSGLSGMYKLQLTLNRVLTEIEEVHVAVFQNRDANYVGFGDWALVPDQGLLAGDAMLETIFNSEAGLSTRLFVHGFALNPLEYHVTVSQVPIPSSVLLWISALLFFIQKGYWRQSKAA